MRNRQSFDERFESDSILQVLLIVIHCSSILQGLLIFIVILFFLTDIGVGLYYLFQKEYVYAGISLFLALVPTFFVQLFSARWHQMDKVFNKSYWAFHSMGLGMIHR